MRKRANVPRIAQPHRVGEGLLDVAGGRFGGAVGSIGRHGSEHNR